MDYFEKAEQKHKEWRGKLEITSRAPLKTKDDLSVAYTPGVAEPCRRIAANPDDAYVYTRRSNMVAVITDGSAVLGLGNIGGLAGMPVMEGKSVLFKEFGGVDAFPICLATQDTEEIIRTITNIAPSFGGINLEDIAAPRCFEIERCLKETLDIPVFHDDQHGTAIVVAAALFNAAKLKNKPLGEFKICISGCGAAGTAIAKLLISLGVSDIFITDSRGIIDRRRSYNDFSKTELAQITNRENRSGGLAEAIVGCDAFIGVSKAGLVSEEMIKSMADKPVVFAMANPVPEIFPDKAIAAGAFIAGSGRSDYPNQVNNVLAFPAIFRGALDARASAITENMKIAAANALADAVETLSPECVIPDPLNREVAAKVARAVYDAALKDGVARIK